MVGSPFTVQPVKGSFGVTIVFYSYCMYIVHISLSTHLVDPQPIGTVYMKQALAKCCNIKILQEILEVEISNSGILHFQDF